MYYEKVDFHFDYTKSPDDIVFFYHWRAMMDGGGCMGGGGMGCGMDCENMASMFPRPQVNNIVAFLSDGYIAE